MRCRKIGGGTLLLTNNRNAVLLYQWLCNCESNVIIFSERFCEEAIRTFNPEIVISYNYKYIIEPNVIDAVDQRIINMHISFLPYNRGAQPNFWSFIDDTPKGVTIHRLERGLDKGDIICQKKVMFDESVETFASTYVKLNNEIVKLLQENWEQIKSGQIKGKMQEGSGSYHDVSAFRAYTERYPLNWNDVIADYKKRCKKH